ncbi:hypothetical protein FB45DRAFT_746461 [Roridomyces roridus]|uniref:Magnesium transport protein CorA n=1 Tax=Roridomyces roridus TaxID=1738132 RepID=A0AAD7FQ86_9AGAR|nr:hypothetical protein FB45DRAFT_746461 [Roridomyces roridus]
MHSSSSTSSAHSLHYNSRPTIGSEPGINPRADGADEKYSHYHQQCLIQVTEYSTDNVSQKTMSNVDFVKSIEAGQVDAIRWINVGGISWDVLSALALRYVDLHSLALEDILQDDPHHQSKADYYPQHLFLRVLCHTLHDGPTKLPVDYIARCNDVENYPVSKESDLGRAGSISRRFQARQQQIRRIAALTKGDRILVNHEPMFIFLLREGTVISIHPTPDLRFTEPVMQRLQRHDSVLRTSQDPAILVEAILDLIVDRIVEILDSYQDKLLKIEHDILLKPGMSTVRSLHILSGDLILNKRTVEPIRSLVNGLREYDQQRCAPLGWPSDNGYMSSQAKVYLADVQDHLDFVLTSLDMFSGISENLINYAFNMASYEMNQVMRRLTLATIIFLPLTLLTGYFGMNFASMDSVQDHSELLFWIISLPVMAVIVPLFLHSDIIAVVHHVKKVLGARRAVSAQR